MAASDVSDNVEAISPHTIGAGGTISVSTFTTFYNLAVDQTTLDDPGWTTNQLYEAQALLVCHYIARRQGQAGKVSESGIGTYSYSRGAKAGMTAWMDEYQALLTLGAGGGAITANDLLGDGGTGINHIDEQQSKEYRPDQAEDRGQVDSATHDYPDGEDIWYGGT